MENIKLLKKDIEFSGKWMDLDIKEDSKCGNIPKKTSMIWM